MTKRILILDCSEEKEKVSGKAETYHRFFMSPYGGSWASEEIECESARHFSESKLKEKLNSLSGLEYFIFVYCGADGDVLGDTSNAQLRLMGEEKIRVADVSAAAARQLCVIDNSPADGDESYMDDGSLLKVSSPKILGDFYIRKRYEELVRKSLPGRKNLFVRSDGTGCSPSFVFIPLAVVKHMESPNSKVKLDFIEAEESLELVRTVEPGARVLENNSQPSVRHPYPTTPKLPWVLNPTKVYHEELEKLTSKCQGNRNMDMWNGITQASKQQSYVQSGPFR